jgi:hypothetical protein
MLWPCVPVGLNWGFQKTDGGALIPSQFGPELVSLNSGGQGPAPRPAP